MNTLTPADKSMALDFINRLIDKGFAKQDKSWYCWRFSYEKEREFYDFAKLFGYTIYGGAEKICFVNEHRDWVIKLDCWSDDRNCVIESNNYREAEKRHLDRYFAETHFLANVGGLDFFIQKKATISESHNESVLCDYISEYVLDRSCYEDDCDFNDAIAAEEENMDDEDRIRGMFDGSPDVEDLVDLINDLRINDLHSGNWGVINGNTVITDFAGV